MVRNPKISCSPYLRAARRELSDACRQIAQARGDAKPPCQACPLADICKPPRPASLAVVKRPQGAAPPAAPAPRKTAA